MLPLIKRRVGEYVTALEAEVKLINTLLHSFVEDKVTNIGL